MRFHASLVGLGLGLSLSLGLVALTPGCGEEEADPREGVLAHLAEAGTKGALDLAEATLALEEATRSLCAAPTVASLGDTQESWRRARRSWSRHFAFGFGPASAQRSALDFWPVRTTTVEDAIAAAPAAADPDYIDNLGVSAKGLPALEYILFGVDEDPAALVAGLGDNGGQRCVYARMLAEDIAARSALIAAAWVDEYADELRSAGQGSGLYATRKDAVDAVINYLIDSLATMVAAKLDTPLGNLSGAPPAPENLESRFSGATRDDLQANLEGFWSAYHGEADAAAAGLSVLVADAGGDSDLRARDQYAIALEEVLALPTPASEALAPERARFQTVRDELDALRRLLKLDVASLLGVTLALSDNDGD